MHQMSNSPRTPPLQNVLARVIDRFESDREAALNWLDTSQPALGGGVPIQVASSKMGASEVDAVIGRLEHGVFS